MPDISNERVFAGGIKVKAIFEAECKWKLIEEFGMGCFEELDDGKLLFQEEYTNEEYLMTWIISFRDKVELLEPRELREEMIKSIEQMKRKYSSNE